MNKEMSESEKNRAALLAGLIRAVKAGDDAVNYLQRAIKEKPGIGCGNAGLLGAARANLAGAKLAEAEVHDAWHALALVVCILSDKEGFLRGRSLSLPGGAE